MIQISDATDTSKAKKLTLRRESLRELTTAELGQVAGGTGSTDNWPNSLGCPKPSGQCRLQ